MSRAKQVLGKDLMLFVGGKAIALATSCKIGISAETIDTQSKDSGIWNEKDIKKLGWNCSSENCFSADLDINGYDALFAMMVAAQPINVAFGIPVNKSTEMPESGWKLPASPYKGKALITSLELNAPDGDKATFSVSMDGTGELLKGDFSIENRPTAVLWEGEIYDTALFRQYDSVANGYIHSISGGSKCKLRADNIGKGVTGMKGYLKGVMLQSELFGEVTIENDSINFSTKEDIDIDIDCIELIGGKCWVAQGIPI